MNLTAILELVIAPAVFRKLVRQRRIEVTSFRMQFFPQKQQLYTTQALFPTVKDQDTEKLSRSRHLDYDCSNVKGKLDSS